MFGVVTANRKDLTKAQMHRYRAVYCGICRKIGTQASQTARLALRYDMAFLALLFMSLYEPEEKTGKGICLVHPLTPRNWTDNEYICYAADMNVALAYYQARDDEADDHRPGAAVMAKVFEKSLEAIRWRWPRQCDAMAKCIAELRELESSGCANPDEPAGCFGRLMGELMVVREDRWAPTLRQLGQALGRYIYLLDAMVDYRSDKKKQRYNPFLAMGMEEEWKSWEQYLVLEMARCTEHFEHLPLVQDKPLLDCILYSGVWMEFERVRPGKRDAVEETK